MKAIELISVSKRFGTKEVLKGFNLSIKAGERIAILGPSGCGKTTILRSIAGLEVPDSGEIKINGQTASRDGIILIPPEKRNIGMVFQDLALWPHMTVRGNLDFVLRARGFDAKERKERISQMLSMVNLQGFENRKISQLSGGEQQRVALARALVYEPSVVLMDEPLSSLDEELKIKLMEQILSLHKTLNFTLVYVTHSHGEAKHLSTRIIHLTPTDR